MTDYRIFNEDILKWAAEYDGPKFHAILADPPYHLTSITKRFGKKGSAPAKFGKDGAFQRASTGFMGAVWDGGDIAFRPETWRAIGKLLYPGAFGMAFAGTRGYHRMAVAIEDAGFIIHPVLCWIFSSGFPKATRIDKQIDKHGGQSIGWFGKWLREYREEKGIKQKELAKHFLSRTGGLTGCVANWELGLNTPTVDQFNKLCEVLDLPFESLQEAERKVIGHASDSGKRQVTILPDKPREWDITVSATDLARAWEGHRYGLQALKPSVELICVFQKPYEGRPIDNITETGAGALNIDGGRIGYSINDDTRIGKGYSHRVEPGYKVGEAYNHKSGELQRLHHQSGRWPANIVMSHSPECELVGYRDADDYNINRFTDGAKPFGDGAGHEYETEIIKAGNLPIYECVEGCAVRALDKQTGTLKSGYMKGDFTGWGTQGIYGKGKKHHQETYGDSGGASRFFFNADYMYERLEQAGPFKYQAKVSKSERNAGLKKDKEYELEHSRFDKCAECGGIILQNPDMPSACKCESPAREHNKVKGNPHPTLKPIALIRWLAALLLPPEEYAPRRILVPFSGTASEMIGAFQAGWDDITGVELEEEYVEIANARMEYWLKLGVQLPMKLDNS